MSTTLLLGGARRRTLNNHPELCLSEWLEGFLCIECPIGPVMYHIGDWVKDYNRQHNNGLTRYLVRQRIFPKGGRDAIDFMKMMIITKTHFPEWS